jgi:hypothetical protein
MAEEALSKIGVGMNLHLELQILSGVFHLFGKYNMP